MALTWYSSAGQPADAVGVDGDLAWDYSNRITWGPKGRVTAGSWASTAYSNIGPTGPAMLSGTGAPGSTYGQNGNGYCDLTTGYTYLKSNNAWSQVGSIVGPAGAAGAAGAAGTSGSNRNVVAGEWWRAGASTAGTAYPICKVLSNADSGTNSQAYNVALQEPMWAAGSLVALTAYAFGNVAGVLTVNILKNGTNVHTASNFLTTTTAGGVTTATKSLSGLTFAANDVYSMTISSSTGTANQHAFVNLFYNTAS